MLNRPFSTTAVAKLVIADAGHMIAACWFLNDATAFTLFVLEFIFKKINAYLFALTSMRLKHTLGTVLSSTDHTFCRVLVCQEIAETVFTGAGLCVRCIIDPMKNQYFIVFLLLFCWKLKNQIWKFIENCGAALNGAPNLFVLF